MATGDVILFNAFAEKIGDKVSQGFINSNDRLIVDSIGGLCIQAGVSRIATWNEGGKPITPLRGTIGFNTNNNSLQIYDGENWHEIILS